jgi:hypothetical protein
MLLRPPAERVLATLSTRRARSKRSTAGWTVPHFVPLVAWFLREGMSLSRLRRLPLTASTAHGASCVGRRTDGAPSHRHRASLGIPRID